MQNRKGPNCSSYWYVKILFMYVKPINRILEAETYKREGLEMEHRAVLKWKIFYYSRTLVCEHISNSVNEVSVFVVFNGRLSFPLSRGLSGRQTTSRWEHGHRKSGTGYIDTRRKNEDGIDDEDDDDEDDDDDDDDDDDEEEDDATTTTRTRRRRRRVGSWWRRGRRQQ